MFLFRPSFVSLVIVIFVLEGTGSSIGEGLAPRIHHVLNLSP